MLLKSQDLCEPLTSKETRLPVSSGRNIDDLKKAAFTQKSLGTEEPLYNCETHEGFENIDLLSISRVESRTHNCQGLCQLTQLCHQSDGFMA